MTEQVVPIARHLRNIAEMLPPVPAVKLRKSMNSRTGDAAPIDAFGGHFSANQVYMTIAWARIIRSTR